VASGVGGPSALGPVLVRRLSAVWHCRTGHVAELLLAGIFSHEPFDTGLGLAVPLPVLALFIDRIGLPFQKVEYGANNHLHHVLDIHAFAVFDHVNLTSSISHHGFQFSKTFGAIP